MMRRPAHGSTRRPPLPRPGNGFGRGIRPRPSDRWRDLLAIRTARALDLGLEAMLAGEVEETASGDAVISL
jgi:hypothetical protein